MSTFRAEITSTARRQGSGLKHPGPQFDIPLRAHQEPCQPSRPTSSSSNSTQGKQLERVVSVLLRELSETRKEKAEKDAQLTTYKEEYLSLLRSGPPGRKTTATSKEVAQQKGAPAFRPSGVAPAPRKASSSRPPNVTSGEMQRRNTQELDATLKQQAETLAGLQHDNTDLRQQLKELQAQLMVASVPAQTIQLQRPVSPGITTATVRVSSPGRGGRDECNLTMAVFEPPAVEAGELKLQLNKLQRENLKLSSKHKAAESELANRSITAKRWEEACEAQAVQVAALKVELEQERRCRAQLEQVVARAGDECDARDADVSALLAQLRSAEGAAAAAQGEAAGLRLQLSQVEGLLAAKQQEVQQLREHINNTVARLQASELVRHEAESEKHILVATNDRLQQEADDAQQQAEAECLELRSAVGTLQSRLDAEEQRSTMLQAQLTLLEQQSHETERMLQEQLRTVQEERNACLAAATRADALLMKLGSHALGVVGKGGEISSA